MTEENLIQGSKKWLKWRQGKITATNACIIMNGVHFDETPLMLYKEKIADELIEKPMTHAMEEGKRKEPLALSKFEAETGYLMNRPTKVHPTLKWMAASLDGYEIEGACALEIKCPLRASSESHQLALKGIVSPAYFPQLQHIMEVCQLEEIYYMSYISDLDYIIFKVKKDHDYTVKLLAAELKFWNRIQERNPPEPTNKDIEKVDSSEWAINVNEWNANQEIINKCLLEQERIKSNFIRMANDKSAEGSGLRLSKVIRKGNIQYTKVPHLVGVDLEPYRASSTEFWKISIQDKAVNE